jgi:hypothetical protein
MWGRESLPLALRRLEEGWVLPPTISRRIAALASVPLAIPGGFGMLRAPMSNRAIWSMRKRHEWLATPLKKKRVKKATRLRCGLQDAMDRKAAKAGDATS